MSVDNSTGVPAEADCLLSKWLPGTSLYLPRHLSMDASRHFDNRQSASAGTPDNSTRLVINRILFIFFFILGLSGCSTDTVCAPVVEVSAIEPLPKNGIYHVHQDDSLYSIAWRYGLDYRYLAKINNLTQSYHIEPGQVIYLRSHHTSLFHPTIALKEPAKRPYQRISTSIASLEIEPTASVSYWHWPAQGPLIGDFSKLNKGINISGIAGQPIYAAAPGKVVYSGNGLKAYGNLIIIKHNSVYLSAYAHSSVVLVKEGDWVKNGQKIAYMGKTGSKKVMLHFEIRRNGHPVNPLSYLAKK